MLKTPIAKSVALASLGAALAIPSVSHAAFIEDGKASLELRNFYFNRDFRQDTAVQSKAEEWGQGFLLRYESGFTEGSVGVGVDAMGLMGVKLYSSDETAGSGLFPSTFGNEAPGEYSELGAAAKFKASNTVLKVGTLQPKNMAVSSSDSRLLPQTFQGGQIVSNEIKGLTLDAGYLNRVNNRNSTDNQELLFTSRGATVGADAEKDHFVFAGGSYKALDNLTAAYYYSNLEDVYKQHSTNLVYVLPLADKQSLKTDLRYARSTDDGSSNVDNTALGAMVTYSLSGHSLGLGYQKMSGDTGFAYLGEFADPFLVNYVQIGDFANADEKSWQARYDFNFASIGVPGLTFMTRYVSGDDFTRANGASGEEWERNTDIAYVVQQGPLKNLGLKWRNATFRSNSTGNDLDENRLIVSYTLPLM